MQQKVVFSYIYRYLDGYCGLPSAASRGIFISFIESSLIGICYFLSLYFVNELKMGVAKAGMIMSFYGIGTVIGGFLGGKMADCVRPIFVSIASLILQSFVFIGLSCVQSVYILSIILFLAGLASYAFIASNHAWVLSHCDGDEVHRLKAINILGVISNLGLGISAVIIGYLNTESFGSIFKYSAILLLLIASYLYIKEASSLVDNQTRSQILVKENYDGCSRKNHSVINFTLISLFISGIIISQTSSAYSVYLERIFPAMGLKSFSILFAINTFMVVLLQVPISNLLIKYNKILIIGSGVFLLGLGMSLLSFATHYFIAVIACFIMTIGEIIFFSISFLVCYEYSDKCKKGQGIGLYRSVYASSRIVGPFAGGLIYSCFSGKVLWYCCGMLGIAGLLLAFFYTYAAPQKLSISSK